jgi:hypothetical protein
MLPIYVEGWDQENFLAVSDQPGKQTFMRPYLNRKVSWGDTYESVHLMIRTELQQWQILLTETQEIIGM